jgi:hypothetical protein
LWKVCEKRYTIGGAGFLHQRRVRLADDTADAGCGARGGQPDNS